jgi:hypothetical protein
MRDPELIRLKIEEWIKGSHDTSLPIVIELVKMVILAVPPVKLHLVGAVITSSNPSLGRLDLMQTIEDPNIKEEILFRMADAFDGGEIQLIVGETAEDIMDEFKELTERQALGMVCGCALLGSADNLKWDDVFVIDDDLPFEKMTTDIIDM